MKLYRRRKNHRKLTTCNHHRQSNKKNTVIKNDLATVTGKKPRIEPAMTQQKPRLIHMVTCKI